MKERNTYINNNFEDYLDIDLEPLRVQGWTNFKNEESSVVSIRILAETIESKYEAKIRKIGQK